MEDKKVKAWKIIKKIVRKSIYRTDYWADYKNNYRKRKAKVLCPNSALM